MYKLSELESWKSARELRQRVSILVQQFPKDENFRKKIRLFARQDPFQQILRKDLGDTITKKIFNTAGWPEDHSMKHRNI